MILHYISRIHILHPLLIGSNRGTIIASFWQWFPRFWGGFVGWEDFPFDKCNCSEKLSREFLELSKFNPSIWKRPCQEIWVSLIDLISQKSIGRLGCLNILTITLWGGGGRSDSGMKRGRGRCKSLACSDPESWYQDIRPPTGLGGARGRIYPKIKRINKVMQLILYSPEYLGNTYLKNIFTIWSQCKTNKWQFVKTYPVRR